MVYFIFIFTIMELFIFFLDRQFYRTIVKILEFKGINSESLLESLGYYNRSIFPNKIYGVLIGLLLSIIIFLASLYKEKRRLEKNKEAIKRLEEDLIKINSGNYKLDLIEDDQYSILRDQIYKIIVSLKSLEEEAKKQKLSLKKDLSNIAHQLKTPITSIGFMAELIREDGDKTEVYLEKLNMELEKLRNFTEILLKLSKVNANAIEYKFIEVSIMELIEDILNSLNRNKRVKIDCVGKDFIILADEVWIYEAFLNIIKNSLENTSDRIIIRLEENPIYKLIKISDNGPGVKEEELSRIFDRFYRGEAALPGYGIGLNLSKVIIENHKGEIKAYNNNGLSFEIKFYNVT